VFWFVFVSVLKSKCNTSLTQADSFLGLILDALDGSGARPQTYVMMVSDHGEDCAEHRQNGKNNMCVFSTQVSLSRTCW
jgi:membrane-anchored protein YejM (alkaline phosphatase superfamily)